MRLIGIIFPKGSYRHRALRKVARILGIRRAADKPYSVWVNERTDKIQLHQVMSFEKTPLISIVVPAFNTPDKYLHPFVTSVITQRYTNWELIIVDASSDKNASVRIAAIAEKDDRVKVVSAENEGIAQNTNVGIKASSGQYIGFMDHDDVLDEAALHEVVIVINENPSVGLVYTDEDKLTDDGSSRLNPHFKPDWSPDLLTHVNYITHFVVAKKEHVTKIGGLDPDKEGAQDYDFLLRITDLGILVKHIPKILYHWRIADGSTAQSISNKPYIFKSGEKALNDHYRRIGINAHSAAISNMPGYFRVTYMPTEKPTIIIAPFSTEALLGKYIRALDKAGLIDYDLILPFDVPISNRRLVIEVDNTKDYLSKATKQAGKYSVIINDFIFPEEKTWASEISGVLEEHHVHAVSPIILGSDRRILDCGIVKQGSETTMLFRGCKLGETTSFGNTTWTRNVDSLSGAVTAARSEELSSYLITNEEALISDYSNRKAKKLNVLWANTVVNHVKNPIVTYGKQGYEYFNPNLTGPSMQLLSDEQQILDALTKIEEEIGKTDE